jgi:predicted NAD-dependent protein-ADP-ribosyltransferase YbiA (DUF1768 family)
MKNMPKVIAFTRVNLPYGWLGNMSDHKMQYGGKEYRTSEALFQCLRFEGYPEAQRIIMNERSPMAAKMKARRLRTELNLGRDDIGGAEDIERMKLCLKLKVEQHPLLIKKRLLETGDAIIIEDCTARPGSTGKIWGAVLKDGEWIGKNLLGKLWMELREELKQSAEN